MKIQWVEASLLPVELAGKRIYRRKKNRRKGREEFLIERGKRTKYITEFACVLLSSLHIID